MPPRRTHKGRGAPESFIMSTFNRGNLVLVLAGLLALAGFQSGLAEARKWIGAPIEEIRQAAEEGDASAQYRLGTNYDWGWGVPEDDETAVKWWRKAAEQGDGGAQSALGNMYYWGWGVPDDYREAARWYRKASEQGVASAQGKLGFMYARGEGVGKDYVKAYAWASLAAAQGEEMPLTTKVFGIEGETTLKAWLREQMTSRQIGRAQTLAAEIFNRIESSKSK